MASRITEVLQQRELLRRHRSDLAGARGSFKWPSVPSDFNFVRDYFDVVAKKAPSKPALHIVDAEAGESRMTYGELSRSAHRAALWLYSLGLRRGDRVLLMLNNTTELWILTLAAIKLSLCPVPCTTMLTQADLGDRIARSGPRAAIAIFESVDLIDSASSLNLIKIAVGRGAKQGWIRFDDSTIAPQETMLPPTSSTDELFLYFTSGTTSKPKMVVHTHISYTIGHLSTMYWLGLQENDVHLNISTPGWAKHAWSNMFAPLLAECCIFVYVPAGGRFDASALLNVLHKYPVTSMCIPPTAWRVLVQAPDLRTAGRPPALRECVSAGEPLNPRVLQTIADSWGIHIREGFGQTEVTACVGYPPGTRVIPGHMGYCLPGYEVDVLDGDGTEGELAIRLNPARPVGLMREYLGDKERTALVIGDSHYRTGDVVHVNAAHPGLFAYVARADDVFKSSGYRLSPFELESALLEHPYVVESAVVPSPDPVRGYIPKAFVTLNDKAPADAKAAAAALFEFIKKRLPPYARPRRVEINSVLPKTVSGKIKRAELRAKESKRSAKIERQENEFWESDFPASRL